MGFRLGLDIGTNSIGWVLLKVKQDNQTVDTPNPKVIEKTGIRIFSDGREPKTYSTKNAQRREHRLAARRRDRFLQRQKYLISFLKDVGLMPQNEKDRKQLQNLDPWELRAKARSEKLSDFELGRIFLHINQRRGFKSNRKSLNKNEDGVVKQSVKEFKEKSGDKTIGEYLYTFHKDRKPIRARRKGSGKKDTYSFYYNRGMLIDEFSKICEKQRSFGNEILSEENQNKLHDIIFFQRPLKRPIVGRCSIFPDKERAPRSLIAFQSLGFYRI